MTKQHTPGPWEVRIPFSTAARFPAYIVSSEPNERFIAAMYGSGGDYDKRLEAAQNARLIAAAPELLEALRQLRMWLPIVTHMAGLDATETQVELSDFADGRPPETISIASSLLAAESAIAKATD